MKGFIMLVLFVWGFFSFSSCEVPFKFKEVGYEPEIVVTSILDPRTGGLVFLDRTYPIVGTYDLDEWPFPDTDISLYENDILVEVLKAGKGENYLKTIPKEEKEYYLRYTFNGKEIKSDKVIVPKAMKSVKIKNVSTGNSQLNSFIPSMEFDIEIEINEAVEEYYSVTIFGRDGGFSQEGNSYNTRQSNLIGDPCTQSGKGKYFVFNSICKLDNKLVQRLGVETNYSSYTEASNTYEKIEVAVERMGDSYKQYITDLNSYGVEKAFTPYFSAYSNFSNNLGVLVTRNSKMITIRNQNINL